MPSDNRSPRNHVGMAGIGDSVAETVDNFGTKMGNANGDVVDNSVATNNAVGSAEVAVNPTRMQASGASLGVYGGKPSWLASVGGGWR